MIDRPISALARWLAHPWGFIATCVGVGIGIGIGYATGFDDHWALVYNTSLSIAAIVLAGIILVAGAKDTAALHLKLNSVIAALDKADNALIGAELLPGDVLAELQATACDHVPSHAVLTRLQPPHE